MDQSYGKIPQKLEEFNFKLNLQKENSWEKFFNATGCSQKFKNSILSDIDKWIQKCIERSRTKGKKYEPKLGNNYQKIEPDVVVSSQMKEAGNSPVTLITNFSNILQDITVNQQKIQQEERSTVNIQNSQIESQEKEKPKYEIYKVMLLNEKGEIDQFIQQTKINEDFQNWLYELIGGILERNNKIFEIKLEKFKNQQLLMIKEQVFCYFAEMSFKGEIFGYSIYHDKYLISTSAQLISSNQFKERNQLQTKKPIIGFLPAYISPKHAKDNKQWTIVTKHSLKQISQLIDMSGYSFQQYTLKIFPYLINSMIIEIEKNDQSKIAIFFEAMCSFWRTLRFFYTNTKGLQDTALNIIKNFTRDESSDLGIVLGIASTLTDKIIFHEFIDSYLEESFVRSVAQWNQDANSKEKLFESTKVKKNEVIKNEVKNDNQKFINCFIFADQYYYWKLTLRN
eukprot:TRINITY_DN2706_c0_g1_i13.p1 TRINITY_DN2706_c0_g1~~TRINITY_DN2706_c0_g1_i13.p1  ORF type:complete len:453 (+),score=75.86 TRINITY_DN2706_c0_g1_i13:1708-3066(+)